MRKGFTLIELLIVIAIVAILAGAMVPMMNVTREQARDAKASSDMDAIKTASIMLHHDTGSWPPAGSIGNGILDNTGIPVGWNGPYLDAWRLDPWGSSYSIDVVAGATGSVSVASPGGAAGTLSLIITPNKSI